MAILGRDDLRNQLKRREFAPVYLLFGPEIYLRDLAAKTIADLVLANSELREFNEIEHSLNDSKLNYALSDAEQMPMIASKRVIKITNIVISATGKKEYGNQPGRNGQKLTKPTMTVPSASTNTFRIQGSVHAEKPTN